MNRHICFPLFFFSLGLIVILSSPGFGQESDVIFRDDFSGSALEKGWVWEPSPDGETSYSLIQNPGFLTLINKSGGGMWDKNTGAPKLYRTIGTEEISITVKISEYKPVQEWEEAGLFIRQDKNNWFKIQKAFNGKNEQLDCAGYVNGTVKEFRTPKYEGGDLWLRIKKKDNNYSFTYSKNNQFYIFLGMIPADPYLSPKVGVFASCWNFPKPNMVKFDFFEITKVIK